MKTFVQCNVTKRIKSHSTIYTYSYVSCSECSYDSETCTCVSADRCYCSLRTGHAHHKMRCKNEPLRRSSKHRHNEFNRDSLISCKSDEKCYCSMVEEENKMPEDDSHNTTSDTTWCDTDSCVSASKCYCKRNERRVKPRSNGERQHERSRGNQRSHSSHSHKSATNKKNKFALDYELFTIGGNGKSVQPHEALSMKKSVEAAAIFADVKLSQTTDIKSLCSGLTPMKHASQGNVRNMNGSCRSVYSTKKQVHAYRKKESFSIERRNERNAAMSLSSSSSQKSGSADDLLSKLSAIEKAVEYAASVKSTTNRKNELFKHYGLKENYQSMRAVGTSLEDTLGYLP